MHRAYLIITPRIFCFIREEAVVKYLPLFYLSNLQRPPSFKAMTRRVIENYNSQIIKLLSVRPIAFNPYLGKISGSATAGLFLSQLLYWWDKGSTYGWIYKTIEEVKKETCLTRSEQAIAIKIWKGLGILETKLAGIPPKRHFKILIDELLVLLEKFRDIPTNPFTDVSDTVDDGKTMPDFFQDSAE